MNRWLALLMMVTGLMCVTSHGAVAAEWEWEFLAAPFTDRWIDVLKVDPESDRYLYAGSMNGLYVSHDFGQSWTLPLLGWVTDIAIDPVHPARIYALVDPARAIPGRSVYRSEDRGRTWQHLTDLNHCTDRIRVGTVDPSAVYVGARFTSDCVAGDPGPAGVFKGSDHGQLWTLLLFGTAQPDLITWDVAEDSAGTLYASTEIAEKPDLYDPPLFRSTDGGLTWDDPSRTITWHSTDLGVDPQTDEIFFLSEGPGLFRSPDRGDTWSWSYSPCTHSLVLDPLQPGHILCAAVVWDVWNGGVFFSDSHGLDFELKGLEGMTPTDIALSPYRVRVYASTSDDGIYQTVFDCPVEELLSGKADTTLDTIYDFRDHGLGRGQDGRELTRLYYLHAAEILNILREQPEVRERTLRLLVDNLGVLARAAKSGVAELTADNLRDGYALIDMYRRYASRDLEEALHVLEAFARERARLTPSGTYEIDLGDDYRKLAGTALESALTSGALW